MTETLVAPSAAHDAAAAVLQALEGSDRPLTLNQIRDRCAGGKPSPNLLRGVLAEQARHGRVFTCSPLRGVSRFWHRDEKQLGRERVLELLRGQSRTGKELAAKLARELPPGSSNKWRLQLIAELQEEGKLYRHPKGGRLRSDHLALQPASLRPYLTKKILGQLNAACNKVERAGVARAHVLDELLQLLQPPRSGAKTREPTPQQAHPQTLPTAPRSELEELILKVMLDVEPEANEGRLVAVREVRRGMPAEYRGREVFDRAIISLAEQGLIHLHRHNYPGELTDTDRQEFVQDPQGNYIMGIAKSQPR